MGSLSAGKPSAASYHQAIDLLVQGLAQAPARMDIYLGLGTLHQETNDTGALIKDLSEWPPTPNRILANSSDATANPAPNPPTKTSP